MTDFDKEIIMIVPTEFEIILEVNNYLHQNGVELKFSTIKELLDAYISCRESNYKFNNIYCKSLQQVRQDIERDWVANLDKDCYTISQLEQMTLAELTDLMR